jgi:hypothetical protein
MPDFTPLVERQEIVDAWTTFCEQMKRGSDSVERVIGWQGGSEKHTLYWHAEAGIWCAFDSHVDDSYHAGRYGTIDPRRPSNPIHVCSINLPKEGPDGRCGGLFLRDQESVVYLTHSGKVGGGRTGISKTGFVSFYTDGEPVIVPWSRRNTIRVFMLGRIDADDLVPKVAQFVRTVERYKLAAVSGGRG